MTTEEQALLEMQKPIGVALMPLEWFVLLAFFDHLSNLDEEVINKIFSSKEDFDGVMKTVQTIHNQAFPPKKDNLQELAESLEIKPKKIITAPSTLIV
jgi:hypothetical protein